MATKDEIVNVIKTIFDPEIPVNIYDLGLIYNVDAKPEEVLVQMTLTSQGCPSAQEIPEMVRSRIQSQLNVPSVRVNVVWDPPWHPSMISDEGKKILQIGPEEP